MLRTLIRKSAAARTSGDKVVVLGSGWGGFNIAQTVNKEVPLTVISPANHFLFTPLLPSSAVGTLEFRCIEEPIRYGLSVFDQSPPRHCLSNLVTSLLDVT